MPRQRPRTSASQSGPSSEGGESREGAMYPDRTVPPISTVHTVEELQHVGGDNTLEPNDIESMRFRRCILRTVIQAYCTLCLLARQFLSVAGMDRLFNVVGPNNRFPQEQHAGIAALVERWSPSTHTFHFRDFEIGITPLDLTMILGIPFAGPYTRPVPYDLSFATPEVLATLFPHLDQEEDVDDKGVKHSALVRLVYRQRDEDEDERNFAVEQARAFFLWFIGYFLFPSSSASTPVGWLVGLADLGQLGSYDWGMAMLASIYNGLDAAAKKRRQNFNGNWVVLQVWLFEYLTVLQPLLRRDIVHTPQWPALRRWIDQTFLDSRAGTGRSQPVDTARQQLDLRTRTSVRWRPWPDCFSGEPFVQNAFWWSVRRFPLHYPHAQAWYLGERLTFQLQGLYGIPLDPPPIPFPPRVLFSLRDWMYWRTNGWWTIADVSHAFPVTADEWDEYWRYVTTVRRVTEGSHRRHNVDFVTPSPSESYIPRPASPVRQRVTYSATAVEPDTSSVCSP